MKQAKPLLTIQEKCVMQGCNKKAVWKGSPKGYVSNAYYCEKCKHNQETKNSEHWENFAELK